MAIGSADRRKIKMLSRRQTAATAVRYQRQRKEGRLTAYFFVAGLERAFAFGLVTLSTGLVCLTVLGFGVETFGLVFFAMISSCFGRR